MIEAIDSIKGSDDILELLKRFRATDDEYTEQFGDNLVLQVPVGQQHQTLVPTLQASPYFKKVLRALQTSHGNLPSGPYFLSKNGIHQAWRLYEDDLDAFIIPTIPSNVTLVDE